MREIRFRCWNKKKKFMDSAWLLDFEHARVCHAYHNESNMDDCEIMQFTGLRDKNGKKIYEGDVLQSVGLNGNKENSLVYWSKNSLRWQTDFKSQCLNFAISTWLEIVGNVYENPELLNEKEATE